MGRKAAGGVLNLYHVFHGAASQRSTKTGRNTRQSGAPGSRSLAQIPDSSGQGKLLVSQVEEIAGLGTLR